MTQTTTLVPRSSLQLSNNRIEKFLNGPAFADGLVSIDRIASADPASALSKAELSRLTQACVTSAAEHAKLPEVEQLRIQVEARTTQMQRTLESHEDWYASHPEWARDAAAQRTVQTMQERWGAMSSATETVMTQYGLDKAPWYAGWVGTAAALSASLTRFADVVAEGQRTAKDARQFAGDVEKLTCEQQEKLQAGLEACLRAGIGFKVAEDRALQPSPAILGAVIDGAKINYGRTYVDRTSGTVPVVSIPDAKPVETLNELVGLIRRYAKIDLTEAMRLP